ncbi:MAG: zinc ribbon domain-containing protein [Chloroflexi bacterium]|nr:zinc ribbon domain-containing protein [Chloroflexota bacterium]
MAELISFTRNHSDQSSDQGFQFEFYCDHCGSGYRSSFRRSVTGTANEAIGAVGDIFGGLFGGRAESVSGRVHNAVWYRERDKAFQDAQNEVMRFFTRCPRCTSHVCESCWNEEAQLCISCAPKLASEMAAARVDVGLGQMREAIQKEKVFGGDTSQKVTTCPQCGKPVASEKFCSNCGAPLGFMTCSKCGKQSPPGTKFCGDCGNKL